MLGPVFVILGAFLWATDTVFRKPLTGQVSSLTLVLFEHGIALIPPALYFVLRKKKITLHWKEWLGIMSIGVLGSALATLLFTQSFAWSQPSVSILIQKTQPIIVIAFSGIFLKEKLPRFYFPLSLVAMVSAFFMSFPNGIFLEAELEKTHLFGIVCAFGAALLWATSTVIGRGLLSKKHSSHSITFLRFLFGFLFLLAISRLSYQSTIEVPFLLADLSFLEKISYVALVPGFLGVSLYYMGLSRVTASVATILELTYPLTAILINSLTLGEKLLPFQWLMAFVLMSSIGLLSFLNPKN